MFNLLTTPVSNFDEKNKLKIPINKKSKRCCSLVSSSLKIHIINLDVSQKNLSNICPSTYAPTDNMASTVHRKCVIIIYKRN